MPASTELADSTDVVTPRRYKTMSELTAQVAAPASEVAAQVVLSLSEAHVVLGLAATNAAETAHLTPCSIWNLHMGGLWAQLLTM